MTWVFSVSGVVEILGSVENRWEEIVIKLRTGELDVVLNTITISIVDLVVVKGVGVDILLLSREFVVDFVVV